MKELNYVLIEMLYGAYLMDNDINYEHFINTTEKYIEITEKDKVDIKKIIEIYKTENISEEEKYNLFTEYLKNGV